MGFLDRFRKSRTDSTTSTAVTRAPGGAFPPPVIAGTMRPARAVGTLTPAHGEANGCTILRGNLVMVVGESHYQDALRAAVKSIDAGAECVATLVPEPANAYDAQAVMVCITGRPVGYLSREDARQYRSLVDTAIAAHGQARVAARLTGGWDRGGGDVGMFGVDLYFSDRPSSVAAPAAGEARLVGASTVSVSNEEHYQQALLDALGGKSVASYSYPVLAELVQVPRNLHVKKDTGPVLEVRIGTATVGYLTPAMSARFERVRVLASDTARLLTCSASIFAGSKAGETILEVRLSASPHVTTEEYVTDPFFEITTDLVRSKRSSATHRVRECQGDGSYKTMCGVVVQAKDAVMTASCSPPIGDIDPQTHRLVAFQERCQRC